MREREVDRLFVLMAKAAGVEQIYKISSTMNRGVPDRLLVGPGMRHGFVEVKAHDGSLTELQHRTIAALSVSGAFVRVLRGGTDRSSTKRAISRVLDEYMQQRRQRR